MTDKLNRKKIRRIFGDWQLYAMALPCVALLFAFAYMPMGGLILAFKRVTDFSVGIFRSPWADPWYRNFELLFRGNPAALSAMRNTLFMNFLFISVGTVFALALALSFNEIRRPFYKRLTQSISFLPYFISTVVIGIFVSGMLAFETGSVTNLIHSITGERIRFYMEPGYWPGIMLAVNIWRLGGFNAIIYLAAISGIDPQLYEAAEIDGASRMQQTWHVTLPLLVPTIIILTILAIGRIMNADFGLFFNVTRDVASLYPTMDVLDTYIYRALRRSGDIGISTATGFFQSVVSFALVIVSNKLANKIEKGSALF
ncbi:MAG: ABC transporter permease subunit [Defluviitaleaceae bacterium]|nr:ABC transporter permease subunit [Defluviitaleaceae bacterium]MCL2837294.1 ABC transporter permease subunit [Defluviitaleaceae bacterium]